jgi:hypothetical protein
MSKDSFLQSSGESWMMQRESIQRYLMPNPRVKMTASWNVLGRFERGILFDNVETFWVVRVRNLLLPWTG